jgi:hypothetical protein
MFRTYSLHCTACTYSLQTVPFGKLPTVKGHGLRQPACEHRRAAARFACHLPLITCHCFFGHAQNGLTVAAHEGSHTSRQKNVETYALLA